MKKLLLVILLCVFAAGCTSVPIKKGMSKAQVQAIWGSPDMVKTAMNSGDKRPGEEAWHYFGYPYRSQGHDKSVMFRNDRVAFAFKNL
ncbi:MAG: hypothetical protein HQL25_04135 [Candidatus Omnitrophica bacterium]|nr:hypothetical protein [Candidatus Omnitrophota bacterium]